MLLIFLIFPKSILGIFGEEFRTGAIALMILTIGQFVNAASGSVGYILQMTGKQRLFQYIILFASIVNAYLNFILIPQIGIVGAAIASCIAVSIINIIPLFLIKYYYGFFTFPYIKNTPSHEEALNE